MWRASCVMLVLVGACAGRVPMPIMASQLFAEGNGAHLAAYLSQRDASAAVCDLNARGPHLVTIDAGVRRDLMKGLREGLIAPPLWHECVDRLVRSADSESGALLFDDVTRAYSQLIREKKLESSADAQQRFSALHALLVGMTSDVVAHSNAMPRLAAELRAAMTRKRLGPLGQRYAAELIADAELSRGMRDGRPVDVGTLDRLLEAKDDSTLRRYALRLPDPALRSEARRHVIRLHIEQSPFAVVHRDSVAVENMVMEAGSNTVGIAEHPIVRGWIEDSLSAIRTVLVRQDLEHQTSTLVGTLGDEKAVSVLPQLSLRGLLRLQLEGFDRPVTVCGPPEELDVSPCVPASSLRLDNRLAYLEPDGSIRFVEQLTGRATVALARSGRQLVVPVRVGSQQVAALDWQLRFAKPNDIVLGGGANGEEGPELHVRVEQLPTGRLSYDVYGFDRGYVAIVERDQAPMFHVISKGGDGARGRDGLAGQDGLSGTPGSSASCPSTPAGDGGRGGDGSGGEDGAAGEPGGDGGNILVEIRTPGTPADEVVALVRRTVVSRGGSGGAGGSGGNGGRGGPGGSGGGGITCVDSQGAVTTFNPGAQGFNGTDGRQGSSGSSGSNGREGRITVRVLE